MGKSLDSFFECSLLLVNNVMIAFRSQFLAYFGSNEIEKSEVKSATLSSLRLDYFNISSNTCRSYTSTLNI